MDPKTGKFISWEDGSVWNFNRETWELTPALMNLSGAFTRDDAKGNSESNDGKGNWVKKSADGSEENHSADGSSFRRDAKGNTVATAPDGTQVIHQAGRLLLIQ